MNELYLINIASALLIIMALALTPNPFRIMLGLPFVLFFPGYCLTAALYPRRNDLGGQERLALSLGLSLAVVALVELLLNVLPWGLGVGPTVIALACFIATCSLITMRIRARLPRPDRFEIEMDGIVDRARRALSPRVLGVSLLIAAAAFVGWRVVLANSGVSQSATEFYVLGPSGKATNYPDRVVAGRAIDVTLGIASQERQPTVYRITVGRDARVLARVGPVSLSRGQTWTQRVSYTSPKPLGRYRFVFTLFKDDVDAPYRRIYLWVTVLPPPPARSPAPVIM